MKHSNFASNIEREAELFVDVVGYEGRYEVSNLGNVRNIAGHLLKPSSASTRPHLQVTLYRDGSDAGGAFRYVHHLVAEAFLGKRPAKHIVLHYDDDPANNRADNLRYASYAENVHDAIRNGRMKRVKLCACDVGLIRQAAKRGEKQKDIARQFGVSARAISDVVRRTTWSWID